MEEEIGEDIGDKLEQGGSCEEAPQEFEPGRRPNNDGRADHDKDRLGWDELGEENRDWDGGETCFDRVR